MPKKEGIYEIEKNIKKGKKEAGHNNLGRFREYVHRPNKSE